MRRAPLLAVGLLLPALVLAGCGTTTTQRPGVSQTPTGESAPADQAAPAGPHLVAEGRVFDPLADDVDPDSDCEGVAGRDAVEVFDRAAWPALDVPAGEATLTCGNASGAGWRHIADGHTGDFGELADLVDAEWEDVAWFAIDRALEQPTQVEAYRDDIVNYDVLVEYVDGERASRSWMVTVGVGLGSGQIITSFPDEQH
ncbi:hypothetical protein [Agrococcus sp. ARC_14]|uniref:hypothetical protein n=1 Tax=Agrococcus sp. ARC_14 TaxID=2919927 RepID=UPI001F06333A|nr:hypothetical protein [Agrococcus sp. ARC_14]MCH1881573.1 hypothetical protein [Agrococcus sp. ARC_14]